MKYDYKKYYPILSKDKKLKKVIDAVGPCDIEIRKNPKLFPALCRAIVYQQLSGRAAGTIYGRFLDLVGVTHSKLRPEHVHKHTVTKLRKAGLSEAKAKSVKDLAQKVIKKEIPTVNKLKKMNNEEIIESLITVRGIGPWSAEMFMMFTLGRENVLSVGDLGLQKGFAKINKKRKLPTAQEFEKGAKKWEPFRTIACWYLWRALEIE